MTAFSFKLGLLLVLSSTAQAADFFTSSNFYCGFSMQVTSSSSKPVHLTSSRTVLGRRSLNWTSDQSTTPLTLIEAWPNFYFSDSDPLFSRNGANAKLFNSEHVVVRIVESDSRAQLAAVEVYRIDETERQKLNWISNFGILNGTFVKPNFNSYTLLTKGTVSRVCPL